nr:MAG TPA: hypothetical protein [Caudoviricetes sp.]
MFFEKISAKRMFFFAFDKLGGSGVFVEMK